MTPSELEQARVELDLVRSRRELLFWTLHEWIAIVMLAGAALTLLLSLAHGDAIDVPHVLTGTGIASAGVVLRRRRGS